MAETVHNMGYCYYLLKKTKQAIECFEKSIKLHKEINDNVRLSDGLANLGLIYKNKREYVKALDYFQKTYTIDRKLGDKERIIKDEKNINSTKAKL